MSQPDAAIRVYATVTNHHQRAQSREYLLHTILWLCRIVAHPSLLIFIGTFSWICSYCVTANGRSLHKPTWAEGAFISFRAEHSAKSGISRASIRALKQSYYGGTSYVPKLVVSFEQPLLLHTWILLVVKTQVGLFRAPYGALKCICMQSCINSVLILQKTIFKILISGSMFPSSLVLISISLFVFQPHVFRPFSVWLPFAIFYNTKNTLPYEKCSYGYRI